MVRSGRSISVTSGGLVAVLILVVSAAGPMPRVASSLIAVIMIVPSDHHMNMGAMRIHGHDRVVSAFVQVILICGMSWRR